jgi:hypothetical protein
MREFRTSGSVGGRRGDPSVYPTSALQAPRPVLQADGAGPQGGDGIAEWAAWSAPIRRVEVIGTMISDRAHREWRDFAEPRLRYFELQDLSSDQHPAPLIWIQHSMKETRFSRPATFLESPSRESTVNAAVRSGKRFQQRQAPHFRCRTKQSIVRGIEVDAVIKPARLRREGSRSR